MGVSLTKPCLIPVLAGILAMTALTLLSLDIPFFWDTTFFAEGAAFFYSEGTHNLSLPQRIDSGGFPMYALWMWAGWSVFGKTLAVSHLMMLPFLAGIVVEYCKLARRFLKPEMLKYAMLLLLLEPTLMTQGMLMAYDLMLLYFFLLALNALLKGNKTLYALALTFVLLSSVRGVYSLAALTALHLFLVFFLKEKPFRSRSMLVYLAPALVWLAWLIWHYRVAGWVFFSPDRESSHESFAGISMVFRQFMYILWKTFDFGRVILILILIPGIFFAIRKSGFTPELLRLAGIIIIPLSIFLMGMAPLSNPVGHRYFLTVIVMLPIALLYVLPYFRHKITRGLVISCASLTLLSGNFWLYPERLGNGWDSSLKVIPWFEIEKEMNLYITENNILPETTGTLWPVHHKTAYPLPGAASHSFSDLTNTSIEEFRYILQTNICNYFSQEDLRVLRNNWIPLETWKRGQVYAVLYENPAWDNTSLQGFDTKP